MRPFIYVLLALLLIALAPENMGISGQGYPLQATITSRSFPQLPVYFEANAGQVDATIGFIARCDEYILYLNGGEATFVPALGDGGDEDQPRQVPPLQFSLLDANRTPIAIGEDRQPGRSNYLISDDPENWRVNIPHYGRVRYEGVYEGIDLVYYGRAGQCLQYDFILAPYADSAKIRLAFTPVDALTLDANGDLLLQTTGGVMNHQAPVAYQIMGSERFRVDSQYRLLDDGAVGFEVGAYNPSYPLIIDPVIEYSTYIGGSSPDDAWGVAADDYGHAFVTGRTESVDLITSSGVLAESLSGLSDAFVVKLDTNATGAASLVYATYLGGSGSDDGWAIDVDDSGNVYVAGTTGSIDFPTPNGFEDERGQGVCCTQDAFLAKLNPSGTALLYATYIGGTSTDEAFGVAVESSGNAYVMGTTRSETFPTTANGYDIDPTNVFDERRLFVTKIDTNAVGAGSLVYSTYFGGNGADRPGRGIATDGAGNVYISGSTESTDFPLTVSAYQSTLLYGIDAFVARFDTTLSGSASLIYSTLLGGNHVENFNTGGAVACDDNGHAYITGETTSSDFPVVGGFQSLYAGGPSGSEAANADAFVARIDTNAYGEESLEYSTYLGGYGFDQGWGIAATREGNVYVTGQTQSSNFPLLHPIQSVVVGDLGSFVTKIDTDGSGLESLVYSTLLGRGGNGFGGAAVDSNGVAYVAGQIAGQVIGGQPGGVPIFPILNGFQPTYEGNTDGYLVRLGFDADLSVRESALDDLLLIGAEKSFTILVANDGPDTVTGTELVMLLPSGMNYVSASPSQGTCQSVGYTVPCALGNLASDQTVTIDLTVIVPGPIVRRPSRPTILVDWPGRSTLATAGDGVIPRTWRTMPSTSAVAMTRLLAAPYGTPLVIEAEVNGLERDPDATDNALAVILNAIEGSVFQLSNEQVFDAIAAEITTGPGSQYIDFVLPVIRSGGIDMTVRTTDGTAGQVLVAMTNSGGYLLIEVGKIMVDGAAAPAEFVDGINRELPLLVTRSLDDLVGQHAAPGYNLVRITPTEHGLEVIVEE